jgi:hypothetical protein
MMQLRLVVLVVFFVTPLVGQIEIDWTEVPQDIGIQFTHNGAEDVTVDLGQSGGPQTWDFSAQPMGSQYTDALIVPRESTPFGDSFPNSNLVLEITEGSDIGYAYGQIAPTFGANLGFGSVSPTTIFFRFEPTDSYPIPLVYGNNRVYHYGYSLFPIPLTELRTDNYGYEIIDAYGSVTIPYGTFECLRMCSFDTTISTLFVSGIPVTVDTTTHIIYNFMAEDYGLITHVLSYPGETNPNFTDADFLERLTDFSTGIEEHELSPIAFMSLQVSPNPFTHSTQIKCTVEQGNQNISGSAGGISEYQPEELEIYDATGSLVKSFTLPTTYCLLPTVVSWDGRDDQNRKLASGVYFLRLNAGGTSITRTVSLIR